MSEDIAVPVDRLADAIDGTLEIGREHGLPACSWGHAGDGNLHSTFMLDATDRNSVSARWPPRHDLHRLAVALGGTISGEHGVGWLKRGELDLQLGPRELELHRAVKGLFDPHGVMNPGKKA